MARERLAGDEHRHERDGDDRGAGQREGSGPGAGDHRRAHGRAEPDAEVRRRVDERPGDVGRGALGAQRRGLERGGDGAERGEPHARRDEHPGGARERQGEPDQRHGDRGHGRDRQGARAAVEVPGRGPQPDEAERAEHQQHRPDGGLRQPGGQQQHGDVRVHGVLPAEEHRVGAHDEAEPCPPAPGRRRVARGGGLDGDRRQQARHEQGRHRAHGGEHAERPAPAHGRAERRRQRDAEHEAQGAARGHEGEGPAGVQGADQARGVRDRHGEEHRVTEPAQHARARHHGVRRRDGHQQVAHRVRGERAEQQGLAGERPGGDRQRHRAGGDHERVDRDQQARRRLAHPHAACDLRQQAHRQHLGGDGHEVGDAEDGDPGRGVPDGADGGRGGGRHRLILAPAPTRPLRRPRRLRARARGRTGTAGGGVERHVLARRLHRGRRPRQVEREPTLGGHDAGERVEQRRRRGPEVRDQRAAVAQRLEHGGEDRGPVEVDVDDGRHLRRDLGHVRDDVGGEVERAGVEEALEAGAAVLVRCLEAQQRDVGVGGGGDEGRSRDRLGAVLEVGRALDVDAQAAGQREARGAAGRGRQGSDGAGLGAAPGGHEVRVPDDGRRGVGVDEAGAVEQAELELLPQQAGDGRVDARLGDATGAHQLHDELGARLAAELVGAGREDLLQPVDGREVLDAPGAGRERLAEDLGVGHEAPVGADDPVEAELVAQQPREDLPVEPEADLLDRLGPVAEVGLETDRHAVVRHHLPRAGGEEGLEGLQVLGEAAARVHLFAAVGEVRVLAVLLRSAAREVLGHGRDGARAECAGQARLAGDVAGGLEPPHVRGAHPAGEPRVLAEGAVRAGPAGLGGEVDLRVQGRADPDGEVLAAGGVGVLLDEALVAGGGEAERLRPLRERPGQQRGAGVVGERVPRVGGHRDRDAEARGRRELLEPVVPERELVGRGGRREHVEVRHPALDHHVGGGGHAHRGRALGQCAALAHLDHGLEELARLLLERHAREQVGDALGDGTGGVPVRGVGGDGCVGGAGRCGHQRAPRMNRVATAPRATTTAEIANRAV